MCNINVQSFVDQQEWYLHRHIVMTRRPIDVTAKNSRFKSPALLISFKASRRPGFFIWNVLFIMVRGMCLYRSRRLAVFRFYYGYVRSVCTQVLRINKAFNQPTNKISIQPNNKSINQSIIKSINRLINQYFNSGHLRHAYVHPYKVKIERVENTND